MIPVRVFEKQCEVLPPCIDSLVLTCSGSMNCVPFLSKKIEFTSLMAPIAG